MLQACLFAARVSRSDLAPLLEDRLSRLVRFYRPLATSAGPAVQSEFSDGLQLFFGQIRFDGSARTRDGPMLSWGSRPPPRFARSRALLDASDEELRSLDGLLALLAVDRDAACIVNETAGPATICTARSRDVEAWSSHAVAAAWLATGKASVRGDRIPELLAAGYVCGDRSLIDGVRVLPAATRVTVTSAGVRSRNFWPPESRWRPVPEEEAYDCAERELLSSLKRRLDGAQRPLLGLTGGLDSRVLAVALKELGVRFETFTWGERDSEDVTAAQSVARVLGVPHHHQRIEYWDDEAALRRIHALVRWNEGGVPVGYTYPTWPEEMSTMVAGLGGEAGRSSYYWQPDLAAAGGRTPGTDVLVEALERFYAGRLAWAPPDARANVRAQIEKWLEEASNAGYEGWRRIDIRYSQQRLRRWGRVTLPLVAAECVTGFATPGVLRALASLPLEGRLADGFHRRFIERRWPELVPPPPEAGGATPRSAGERTVAAMTARLSRLRRRSAHPVLSIRRRRRRALRRAPGGFEERPALTSWLLEDVLGSALVRDALGSEWVGKVRGGFLEGDALATNRLLAVAAPVALERALEDLRGS